MRSQELCRSLPCAEGQAAVRVKSEHIAPVLDVGVLENGTPYLMMEHLSGADLSEYLVEHRCLPIDEAIDFVLQALDALAVAHSAGIVHRDLKPSNLFVTQRSDGSPLVKVLDFGISKISQQGPDPSATLTRPGMMLGSPRYMSPEQLRNASSVDHRADIWAMGIVLHELIAGTPPYDADTFTALCTMIVSDPPTPLRAMKPDAPVELERIILKCIAKNVADRWQDDGELATALRRSRRRSRAVIATARQQDSRTASRATSRRQDPRASAATKLSAGTAIRTGQDAAALSTGAPPKPHVERTPRRLSAGGRTSSRHR